MDLETFHSKISEHFKSSESDSSSAKSKFLSACTYVPGAYDEDSAFQNLNKEIETLEKERKDSKENNRLFYMALPPNVFTVVAEGLKKNCYAENGNNRIVIEKPFGKDLESSRDMMGKLKPLWKEEETFREYQLEKALSPSSGGSVIKIEQNQGTVRESS